jgi:alginate O-acetyltransferase complex protein AlgI
MVRYFEWMGAAVYTADRRAGAMHGKQFLLDAVHAGPGARAALWPVLAIVLPAGISFYTFELISYVIDVADRRIKADASLLRFTAFATFFPHLIAGPIVRYGELRDQLQALQETPVLRPNFASGLKLLALGLCGKIFIADLCGMAVARARDLPLEQLSAADQLTQIGFWSMQIYYDFWAYSVMAIGLGRLFCIELPVNFREPYRSANPREFWRRWHVTLSYWLRDYVYVRMGGRERYVRNILVVFALVGLWHGAGWNFIAWGVYHGLLVVLYHYTAAAWDRLPRALATALCFALVSLGWPLFFLDLGAYAAFLQHLLVAPLRATLYQPAHWLYLAAIIAFTFGPREARWLYNEADRTNRVTDSPVAAACLLFAGLLGMAALRGVRRKSTSVS